MRIAGVVAGCLDPEKGYGRPVELSTTERSKTCVVTLKNDATPQGLKLELEPGCAAALPFTKEITAWNVRGLDIVRCRMPRDSR